MNLIILMFGLFLLIINCAAESSDLRSSLTFVIDDTGSMSNDISAVKKSVNAIFDTVMNSHSSQIEDFVLVTFNDPKPPVEHHASVLWTKTRDRTEFKNAVSKIRVHDGDDCPEMAMTGIKQALLSSREGSSLYVFTDASAKDYTMYDEIEALSQKMGCQIIFVLTGECYSNGETGRSSPKYKVYNQLAQATDGEVFHLMKTDVEEIIEYVKYNIENRKHTMARKTFPPGNGNTLEVLVDADTKEIVVSVSGRNPSVSITDAKGTAWPTTDIARLSETTIVKAVGVTPGVYTVEVGSTSETNVVVRGSTTVHFQHGFSTIRPSDIKDTVRRPVPDTKSHLSIKLSTEGDVELRSVQILDMDNKVIAEWPLKLVNKDEQFYTTDPITTPHDMFKIAIKGYDVNTKTYLTRLSLTPVQPQKIPATTTRIDPRAPEVKCNKPNVKVAYDKPLQLMCRVSGYPKPNVVWESDDKTAVFSNFESTSEYPYDYISVLDITNVKHNATYTCNAVNSEGDGAGSVAVQTDLKHFFNMKAVPSGTITVEFEKAARIPCLVNAYPPATVSWYKGGRPLIPNGNLQLSHDGSTLVIQSMEPSMADDYICEARNSENQRQFNVKISGAEAPKINKVISEIRVLEHSSVDIRCQITKGMPTPEISWYKRDADYTFRRMHKDEPLDTIHFARVDKTSAGTYLCTVSNTIGFDRHEIDLVVEYEPSISRPLMPVLSVNLGDTVTLVCPAIGEPAPAIAWKLNGYPISSTGRHSIYADGTLRFSAISSDVGDYECEAINPHGVDKINVNLYIAVPVTIEPPSTSLVEQMEGSSVILPCRADGSPKPSIFWVFRSTDTKVGATRLEPSDNTGALRFDRLLLGQSGEYTCVATNSGGSKNITYELSVLAPPTIHYKNKEFRGVVDDMEIVIPCTATGYPKPEITWTIEGIHIASGSKWFDISAEGSLIIKNIIKESEGSYTCAATNLFGQAQEDFRVIVDEFSKPGYISKKIQLEEGDSVTIPCDIPHKRTDRLRWFKDGRPLAASEIQLASIKESDSGTYTCRVTSVDSPGLSDSIKLVVGSKPRFTYDDDKSIPFALGEYAVMDCTATGVPEPELNPALNVNCEAPTEFACDVNSYRDINADSKLPPLIMSKGRTPTLSVLSVKSPTSERERFGALACKLVFLKAINETIMVRWYHNDREIRFNEYKYELEMMSDSEKGRYMCDVSNRFGTIHQEFVVSAFECLLDVNSDFNGSLPLILDPYNKLTNFKTSAGFMRIPKDETIKLVCPSRFNILPATETTLTCEKEQLVQQSSGRSYAFADLKCRDKWQPTAKRSKQLCANGHAEISKVGFNVRGRFQEVYEVCLDTFSKNPIYTKLEMQPSMANNVAEVSPEWFHLGNPVDLDDLYDCNNQNAEISSILNKEFHRSDGCCFERRMLVNPLDVVPGVQSATYTPLNVAPHWGTCDSKNWDEVERRVRNLVVASNRPLQVYTGTAQDLLLPDAYSWQRKVILNSRGKDVPVPKFLWKVVQDSYTKASLAIIQVNVPDLKLAEAHKYILCKDVCKQAEWMTSTRWRNVNHGFTYCCSLADFKRAFRYHVEFPDYDKMLLGVADLPDDHYLHVI